MGIKNLLPFLRPITRHVHISRYRGCRIAVDAMCWMHRGAVSCAVELAADRHSDKFIIALMRMVQLLTVHDIEPLLVFDGAPLPAKREENRRRKQRRKAALAEARKLLADGKSVNDSAVQMKCVEGVHITSKMIARLLAALKEIKICYLVAPFEADAQLAYLCRTGVVDAVITEDSDLLAFGCPRVIFKLDRNGNGHEIDISSIAELPQSQKGLPLQSPPMPTATDGDDNGKITASGQIGDMAIPPVNEISHSDCDVAQVPTIFAPLEQQKAELYHMKRFTLEMFTAMCILAGSDYTADAHINGMGIRTAFKFVNRCRSLSSVLQLLRMDPKWKKKFKRSPVAQEEQSNNQIELRHLQAEIVFRHQFVFDFSHEKLVPISRSHTSGFHLSIPQPVSPSRQRLLLSLCPHESELCIADIVGVAVYDADDMLKIDSEGDALLGCSQPSNDDKNEDETRSVVNSPQPLLRVKEVARGIVDPKTGKLRQLDNEFTASEKAVLNGVNNKCAKDMSAWKDELTENIEQRNAQWRVGGIRGREGGCSEQQAVVDDEVGCDGSSEEGEDDKHRLSDMLRMAFGETANGDLLDDTLWEAETQELRSSGEQGGSDEECRTPIPVFRSESGSYRRWSTGNVVRYDDPSTGTAAHRIHVGGCGQENENCMPRNSLNRDCGVRGRAKRVPVRVARIAEFGGDGQGADVVGNDVVNCNRRRRITGDGSSATAALLGALGGGTQQIEGRCLAPTKRVCLPTTPSCSPQGLSGEYEGQGGGLKKVDESHSGSELNRKRRRVVRVSHDAFANSSFGHTYTNGARGKGKALREIWSTLLG